MIKTNLLPPELQKQKRGKAKKAAGGPKSSGGGSYAMLLLLIILIFGAAIGGSAFTIRSQVSAARELATNAKEKAEKEKATYTKRYAQYQKQLAEYNDMLSKQEILDSLMPEDGLLWTENLNMLAKLIPEKVFITDIKITENVKMVDTKAYIQAKKDWEAEKKAAKAEGLEAPKEPKESKKPVITYRLSISAITPYNQETMLHSRRVVEFRQAIQNYSEMNDKGEEVFFRQHFLLNEANQVSIETPSQKVETVDGQQVWAFTLGLSTMPLIGKE